MKELSTDVAIIGAGTAGRSAQLEVEKANRKSLLIENGPYGSTCARVGCMPSKLLIAAAESAHSVDRAQQFGVNSDCVRIDGPAVMRRVRKYRDEFAQSVKESTEHIPANFRPHGTARFIGKNELLVGEQLKINMKAVVIATGSSPVIPEPFNEFRDEILTNENVFELETLPDRLAVIGTGMVGLELGQAFSRLGVHVSFFNRSRHIGPLTDPALTNYAIKTFAEELDLHQEITITNLRRINGEFEICWVERDRKQEHRKLFSQVLVAAGRKPNLDDLNLETAKLMLDKSGLPKWNPQTTQCGNSPVFLTGDASGYRPLLHEAAEEGRIAGHNSARYPLIESFSRSTALRIAFTDPQMAVVGLAWQEIAPDTSISSDIQYDSQGRARVMGVARGMVRLYANHQNEQLIGAEMFGPRMEHMSHLIAWTIQQKLTIPEILKMPIYHPVLEEGLQSGFRDLSDRLSSKTKP